MSSVASPFGLKPAFHPSGVIRQLQSTILSGFATDIFQFSPIAILADGSLGLVAPGNPTIGSFMGVEWTGTDGRRRVGNRWIANEVGTEIVAYYTEDPYLIYEIQANQTVVLADVGAQFDFVALTGNTVTGLSSVALDVAGGAGTDARIIGVNPAPDNIFGDLFTVVQVQLSDHQFVATRAAI
jgi:hypothetical protein